MEFTEFSQQLTTILGDCGLMSHIPVELPWDWSPPLAIVAPPNIDALAATVARCAQRGAALVAAGGGTDLATGAPPSRPYVLVLLSSMSRVIEYEPDEMVVVCEAGVTLDSVQQLLASHNQRLPLKLPHPSVSTLGGIVSTNRAGMLRASFGAPRDLLIGLTAVMSGGTVIKGGGKVVKNVAGYDLCKLFAGAFGTLGILAGVNFKTTVLTDEAITAIWRAPSLGSALTAGLNLHLARLFTAGFSVTNDLNGDGPILAAYLQGIGERVTWQKQAIEDILVPSGFQPGDVATIAQDEHLLNSTSPMKRPGLLWTAHCSVLPTDLLALAASITAECSDMRITALPGTGEMFLTAVDGTDFWPWQLLDILPMEGNVRFTYVSSLVFELGQVSRWGKARPEAKLHRALKDRLDPENCFSPGRFIDGI